MIARATLLNAVACMIWAAPALLQAAPPAAPTAQRVLLLRNGNVVEGEIEPAGRQLRVKVPHGTLTVQAADVVCEGQDRRALYLHQCQENRPGSHDAHLQLARWCLRQQLLDEADEQIHAALALESGSPAAERLHRQLSLMRQQAAAPSAKSPPRAEMPRKRSDDPVEIARQMAPIVIDEFARQVEPVLLKNCATSLCHGTTVDNPVRWLHGSSAHVVRRPVMLRNLATTLEWIDRQQPERSRLLEQATTPHGAEGRPSLPVDLPTAELLGKWIDSVVHGPPAEVPQTVASRVAALHQANASRRTSRQADEASAPSPESESAPFAAPPVGAVDPFDPAAFNRQFFPEP